MNGTCHIILEDYRDEKDTPNLISNPLGKNGLKKLENGEVVHGEMGYEDVTPKVWLLEAKIRHGIIVDHSSPEDVSDHFDDWREWRKCIRISRETWGSLMEKLRGDEPATVGEQK